MPEFVFAYHGGTTPTDPDEIDKTMAAWGAWFEGMGDAVVNPGNPVGKSSTVTRDSVEDNGGSNPISGFSVIRADDQTAAENFAKGCPMVQDGSGSVEIAQIFEM